MHMNHCAINFIFIFLRAIEKIVTQFKRLFCHSAICHVWYPDLYCHVLPNPPLPRVLLFLTFLPLTKPQIKIYRTILFNIVWVAGSGIVDVALLMTPTVHAFSNL